MQNYGVCYAGLVLIDPSTSSFDTSTMLSAGKGLGFMERAIVANSRNRFTRYSKAVLIFLSVVLVCEYIPIGYSYYTKKKFWDTLKAQRRRRAAIARNTPLCDRVYAAVAKVRNVRFRRFVSYRLEPVITIWLSQSLNVIMFKVHNNSWLWDVTAKVEKRKNINSGIMESFALPVEEAAGLDEAMARHYDLIPFPDTLRVSNNSRWTRIADDEGFEVYEAASPVKSSEGSARPSRKCLYFVDAKTALPRKVEWYWYCEDGVEDYVLEEGLVIEYPSADEIRQVIKDAGF